MNRTMASPMSAPMPNIPPPPLPLEAESLRGVGTAHLLRLVRETRRQRRCAVLLNGPPPALDAHHAGGGGRDTPTPTPTPTPAPTRRIVATPTPTPTRRIVAMPTPTRMGTLQEELAEPLATLEEEVAGADPNAVMAQMHEATKANIRFSETRVEQLERELGQALAVRREHEKCADEAWKCKRCCNTGVDHTGNPCVCVHGKDVMVKRYEGRLRDLELHLAEAVRERDEHAGRLQSRQQRVHELEAMLEQGKEHHAKRYSCLNGQLRAAESQLKMIKHEKAEQAKRLNAANALLRSGAEAQLQDLERQLNESTASRVALQEELEKTRSAQHATLEMQRQDFVEQLREATAARTTMQEELDKTRSAQEEEVGAQRQELEARAALQE